MAIRAVEIVLKERNSASILHQGTQFGGFSNTSRHLVRFHEFCSKYTVAMMENGTLVNNEPIQSACDEEDQSESIHRRMAVQNN